jgi:catechol 2,3-dioxygenase-like lactoylglutathione lyase family enzyme
MNDRQAASLEHVTLTVSNLKRSVEFYRDVLGCPPMGQMVIREGSFKLVWLKCGDGMLELMEFRPRKGKELDPSTPQAVAEQDVGIRHVGFQVQDFDGLVTKLKKRGIAFTLEPTRTEWCDLRVAFFKDPDGNFLEILSGKLENLQPLSFTD